MLQRPSPKTAGELDNVFYSIGKEKSCAPHSTTTKGTSRKHNFKGLKGLPSIYKKRLHTTSDVVEKYILELVAQHPQ